MNISATCEMRNHSSRLRGTQPAENANSTPSSHGTIGDSCHARKRVLEGTSQRSTAQVILPPAVWMKSPDSEYRTADDVRPALHSRRNSDRTRSSETFEMGFKPRRSNVKCWLCTIGAHSEACQLKLSDGGDVLR
jgi:hypothetical protein